MAAMAQVGAEFSWRLFFDKGMVLPQGKIALPSSLFSK
jgi:hypothetical protein